MNWMYLDKPWTKWDRIVVRGLAIGAFGIVLAVAMCSPARPQEDRCWLIEKAVAVVGKDPSAIERLAQAMGIKVTRARRAEARRCLQRIAHND